MAHEQPSAPGADPLAKNNRVDAVVAALLTMVGLVVVFEAQRLEVALCFPVETRLALDHQAADHLPHLLDEPQ